MEVNLGLPRGAEPVDDNHSINDVKLRLWTLIQKHELDGEYTRANTAILALMAIEKLQGGAR